MIAATLVLAALAGAPSATAEAPFRNCTEAKQAGHYNIPQGSDYYWSGGDRDGDGIACEA
ncbi:hypothetical protein AWB99_20155 [Mycolicibacterium confluentis]|uniref:Uncharacterized protein n=2 Tax=Mycolicibacterium confluentis TaxID=28047 RepID=A0A7I7XUH2_9MYCO|nr:excalibur calcium-binding domain-containing protein [Mycolicibacterium confluentis]ORV27080.1 hypothetical protein AWB99_20155 [Mycolicibacterium confluentis]BBZ32723.1 hypothetical protein MCNF_13280 [Mycolicibacterium confluentis]